MTRQISQWCSRLKDPCALIENGLLDNRSKLRSNAEKFKHYPIRYCLGILSKSKQLKTKTSSERTGHFAIIHHNLGD